MIYEIPLLKSVMDEIRNIPELKPEIIKNVDGTTTIKTTHCNENVYRVCQSLGLQVFWNKNASRPMMANEMFDFMAVNPLAYSRFYDHLTAFTLVNQGHLIIAACKEEGHGHVAPLYPSPGMETSGKWGTQTPWCSNVGKTVGPMGVNYAFADPPAYFVFL